MFDARNVLRYARVYQAYQTLGGFFGARLRSIRRYLPIDDGSKIVDIGCGPGYLRRHLPANCGYVGYDSDASYIDFARSHHSAPGTEYCLGQFDASAVAEVAPVDIVMLNGLLHHLTDDEARELIRLALESLRPGGRVFSLDGCYIDGQGWISKMFLDLDRGQFIRSPEAYLKLFPLHAASIEAFISDGLSWIPYSWAIYVATKRFGQSDGLLMGCR
jgi:SAM-dependent methyltransferase